MSPGWTDYELHTFRPAVVLEAKSAGLTWMLQRRMARRRYKLSGVLKLHPEIDAALRQVQHYASDRGIQFAVATNGISWIVFKAVRTDAPWRDGSAVVFDDLADVEADFKLFVDLLSCEGVRSSSLQSEFGQAAIERRQYQRLIDQVPDRGAKKVRNSLHAQIDPVARRFYGELTSDEAVARCYVETTEMKIVDNDIGTIFEDVMPAFLRAAGAVNARRRTSSPLGFSEAVSSLISSSTPDTTLLLCGGIGCGKTTFIRRFFSHSLNADAMERIVKIELEFRAPPASVSELEGFIYSQVKSQLAAQTAVDMSSDAALAEVFRDELKAEDLITDDGVAEGTEVRKAIRGYTRNSRRFVRAAARHCLRHGRILVAVFDNVDQLDHEYQQQIFLQAQTLSRYTPAIVVLAMREEGYFSAAVQKTLGAYKNFTFHVPSPSLQAMLWRRWEYTRSKLRDSQFVDSELSPAPGAYPAADVIDFLKVAHRALSPQLGNREICQFLDAVCYGNMRLALEMFSTFVTSGYLDVGKILRKQREGGYGVPFHEFAKTIILGDFRYYESGRSPVWNVFSVSAERNAGHFTALRMLALLAEKAPFEHAEGRGFSPIRSTVGAFADVFDNEEDAVVTLESLVRRGLAEVDSRSRENLADASHVRITPAGSYYLHRLCGKFVYLDLVVHDTPLASEQLLAYLLRSIRGVDAEEVESRFLRVDAFLDYLAQEEAREAELFGLASVPGVLSRRFVADMKEAFSAEKTVIGARRPARTRAKRS